MARTHDPYYDRKVYHYAGTFAADGEVSALCYRRPHPIPLSRGQSWTIRVDAVTCWRCKQILKIAPTPEDASLPRVASSRAVATD